MGWYYLHHTYLALFHMDMVTYPCSNLNSGLANLISKSGPSGTKPITSFSSFLPVFVIILTLFFYEILL